MGKVNGKRRKGTKDIDLWGQEKRREGREGVTEEGMMREGVGGSKQK